MWTISIGWQLYRHYLVIPVEHIPSAKDLHRSTEDYSLVSHMLEVGQTLLRRDAPQSTQYRFGFHQPPLNSVNHLHLHCLALPYTPRWKRIKFLSLGSLGFLEAEKLLEKLKPLPPVISKVWYSYNWLTLYKVKIWPSPLSLGIHSNGVSFCLVKMLCSVVLNNFGCSCPLIWCVIPDASCLIA